MTTKSKIIEDMRNKIKLEEYGLENVIRFFFLFKIEPKLKLEICLFSHIPLTFPTHMKAMMTVGTLKILKK